MISRNNATQLLFRSILIKFVTVDTEFTSIPLLKPDMNPVTYLLMHGVK